MRNDAEGWCILRTSGRQTLALAYSLKDKGLEAWTPAELKRYPGKKARRPVPIMPTFVFAKAQHLWTLAGLTEDPRSPHPGFSLFRYLDRFPVVADAELEHLRRAEYRAVIQANGPSFGAGDQVSATDGPYCGLGGKVIRCRGEWALVCFGWQRVKISTFILKSADGRKAA